MTEPKRKRGQQKTRVFNRDGYDYRLAQREQRPSKAIGTRFNRWLNAPKTEVVGPRESWWLCEDFYTRAKQEAERMARVTGPVYQVPSSE